MSLGTISSRGTLWSLPVKQCKKRSTKGSSRRGMHDNPKAFQRRSSRVALTNCPAHRALVFSLRASAAYARDCVRRLPISYLTRVAQFRVRCTEQSGRQPTSYGDDRGVNSDLRTRGLVRIAAVIGSATVVSKILGLVRETVLAAVFGLGPVINAFSYSSIIPGFFLTLLGGLNGPFHTAVAATLSKRPKEEGRSLVQRLTIITGLAFGAMSMAIFLFSAPLVDALAPGLKFPGNAGLLTRKLAVIQLRIMAPCTMLAALIGIKFGALSAAGVYGIPSLSPALSSISVLIAVSVYLVVPRKLGPSSPDALAAAVHLAAGVTIGALAQWGLQEMLTEGVLFDWISDGAMKATPFGNAVNQVLAQRRAGFGPLKVSEAELTNIFMDEGIHQVFAVLLPAAVASGMLQIATYTDLHFASFIPGAAAALDYANLLAMAPLGILSSSILVPMLPMFSRLSKPSHEPELEVRVRQGLLLSTVLTLLMTALTVPLARPIVRLVFERRAFDTAASGLVSSLLVCYVLGSTFYLARDLLVRVFYALGDGRVPFQISTVAIVANALLDWLLVRRVGFGVQGLVVATSLVNCGSALALMVKLSSKFQGFRLQHWVRPLFLLGFSALAAGMTTKYAYNLVSGSSFSSVMALNTRSVWVADLISIIFSSAAGVTTYCILLLLFQYPEIKSVLSLLEAEM